MALPPPSTQDVFEFITGDFADAWNALAMFPTNSNAPWGPTHGGNYLFSMQAMVFLEWICRLCKSDETGRALQDFSNELKNVEPRYFTKIPNRCRIPRERLPNGFSLPFVKDLKSDQILLSMLFDLTRNGLVHCYEEIIVCHTGGDLGILSYGVQPGHQLQTVVKFRATHHLSYRLDQSNIIISVHPAILFLDLKTAFENARLADPDRNLTPDLFKRGGEEKSEYQFSPQELEADLRAAGHVVTPDPATTSSATSS